MGKMKQCHYCRAGEAKTKTPAGVLHPDTEDGPQFCVDDETEEVPERQLWEILVPTIGADKGKYIKGYHKQWDAKVRAISGGLTIRPPEKGQWLHPTKGMLHAERMIPVKISCTRDQILEIVKMTIKHYDQDAVLAYKISDEVILMNRAGELT